MSMPSYHIQYLQVPGAHMPFHSPWHYPSGRYLLCSTSHHDSVWKARNQVIFSTDYFSKDADIIDGLTGTELNGVIWNAFHIL